MSKFTSKLKNLIPSKRKLIQLYSALLFNANIKGFINGRIYKGNTKKACTPGLNCYSCPGAVGACPLGSLQSALGASQKSAPFYIIGILMLYGLLLGRFICGFLCPFGLIQEFLYKIKSPKLKKNRVTKVLSYLKYVILVFFVFIIPLLYMVRNVAMPGFCKYICPAGTLEGAFGLLSNKVNEGNLARLGPLFTWKFFLLISIILGSVFVFRLFCRFLCPLGAIYGLFNRFSVFGIKLEKEKCTDCGLCISKCKVDIRHVNDHECINCGECIDVCPTHAISWKGSKIFLPPDEIAPSVAESSTEEEKAMAKKKEEEIKERNESIKKRNKVIKILVGCLMIGVLAFALIYYNFIDKPEEIKLPPPSNQVLDEGAPPLGNKVGNTCYGYDLPVFDENGLTGATFNPANNKGKITIINFWGTWCPPCCGELPDFAKIADEYKDSVTVVAIHTDMDFDSAPAWIKNNPNTTDIINYKFTESSIIFAKDIAVENSPYELYNTYLGIGEAYPSTIILDEKGVIIEYGQKEYHYADLKAIIDKQLAK